MILVESYLPASTRNYHGPVHVRPLEGQGEFLSSYHVECARRLKEEYPVGTIFKIKAKISQRLDGSKYVYSHHKWKVKVIKMGEGEIVPRY